MGRSVFNVARVLAAAALVAVAVSGRGQPSAGSREGIALGIVFDTSGSMKDPVRDSGGRMTPKYLIANRAFKAIVDRLEAYLKQAPAETPRTLQTVLVTFQANHARIAVEYGPFDGRALRAWAENFRTPDGATPLGEAVSLAAAQVLASPLSHKHVLVVTDGENTAGPDPATVIPGLRDKAVRKQTGLGFHFVAFDVEARVFEPVKKLGATVLAAADEKQLNAQLGFILERKILLEEEEPSAKPSANKP